MCSTDFSMLDLFFDKEDPASKGLDGFKNTLFSSSEVLGAGSDEDVKEEVLDSGTIDWKMPNEWDADELLRSVLDGNDMSPPSYDTPSLAYPLSGLGSSHHTLDPSSLATPTLEAPEDDMDSLENLVGLPFHAVLDSAASDSGMSSDSSLDQQMSPVSGYSSPGGSLADMGLGGGGLGMSSPDPALDATSDVSSSSDLGSLGSLGSTSPSGSSPLVASPSSPEHILGLEDFLQPDSGFSSPVPHLVNSSTLASTTAAPTPIFTTTRPTAFITKTAAPTTTIVTRPAAPTIITKPSNATISTGPVLKTVTVAAPASSVATVGGQTIVVTQANRNGGTPHVVRGGTLLKSNNASRSILLPVTMKDLNQVRTIKIISTGGNGGVGGRGVRTVVSTVRTPSTTSSTASSTTSLNSQSIRTALLGTVRGQESKSILKSGATTFLTTSARPISTSVAASSATHLSPTRIKVEAKDEDDDDDDDDEPHTAFQQLTLSDEEKRLLKKEGILLPSHYPLTKQEERELKRIRRKIRNKISAQDSRKRKKEYIDGLEDRVKACTEENQQLQKRIRSLEAQNESLLVQMKRFQNAVTGGNSGRLQTHASTALMMLILSAALFIVPSMRQDGSSSDSELSMPASKMPSAGNSRSLLEVGNMGTLEVLEGVEDELTLEMETPLTQALSDHDYTPVAKKQRTSAPRGTAYFVPPLDDYPPQHGKTDSGGGFPPDDTGSGTKLSARIMDSLADHMSNNYSDPGGKSSSNSNAVVVNLSKGKKRLRDDLELE